MSIIVVGCSSPDSPTESNEDGAAEEKAIEDGNEDIMSVAENTYINGESIETTTEIQLGQSAFLLYPEANLSSEAMVEFIVHGIDYVAEIDIEANLNDRYDFLIIDFEVKNSGKSNITEIHYPQIILHNPSGHEQTFTLQNNGQVNTHTFQRAVLIPGGLSQGLVVIALEEGEEIESILFDTTRYSSENQARPFSLNIEHLDQRANEAATHLQEQLAWSSDEFLQEYFADLDNQVVTHIVASTKTYHLERYGRIAEPNDITAGLHSRDKKDYLAEFIYDDAGLFMGVKFTEQ